MNADLEGDGQVIPDAIRDLLEQRARYQDWLGKLDDVGGKYRQEVADRVRADYLSRLGSVEKELHGHRAELEGSLEDHRGRLEGLTERHEEHAARLEEAELRFQVGEFEQSEWDERRGEGEHELSQVGQELEAERTAVRELDAVLAEVAGDAGRSAARRIEPGAWSGAVVTAAATPVEEPVEEPAAEPAAEPESTWEVGSAGEPEPNETHGVEPAEVGPEHAEGDEDEPLAAVAGATPEAPAEGGPEEDFLDELEFLESLSLDDPESFDAVSRMLEEEESGEPDEDASGRGGAG